MNPPIAVLFEFPAGHRKHLYTFSSPSLTVNRLTTLNLSLAYKDNTEEFYHGAIESPLVKNHLRIVVLNDYSIFSFGGIYNN